MAASSQHRVILTFNPPSGVTLQAGDVTSGKIRLYDRTDKPVAVESGAVTTGPTGPIAVSNGGVVHEWSNEPLDITSVAGKGAYVTPMLTANVGALTLPLDHIVIDGWDGSWYEWSVVVDFVDGRRANVSGQGQINATTDYQAAGSVGPQQDDDSYPVYGSALGVITLGSGHISGLIEAAATAAVEAGLPAAAAAALAPELAVIEADQVLQDNAIAAAQAAADTAQNEVDALEAEVDLNETVRDAEQAAQDSAISAAQSAASTAQSAASTAQSAASAAQSAASAAQSTADAALPATAQAADSAKLDGKAADEFLQYNPSQQLPGDWVNMIPPGEQLLHETGSQGKARFEVKLTNVVDLLSATFVMEAGGNRSTEGASSGVRITYEVFWSGGVLYEPRVLVENRRDETAEAGIRLDGVDGQPILWVDMEQGYWSASLEGRRHANGSSEVNLQPGVALTVSTVNPAENMAEYVVKGGTSVPTIWTPTVEGATTAGVMPVQGGLWVGKYTETQGVVTCLFRWRLAASGVTPGSGSLRVSLPFKCDGAVGIIGHFEYRQGGIDQGPGYATGTNVSDVGYAYLKKPDRTNILASDFIANDFVRGHITYLREQ